MDATYREFPTSHFTSARRPPSTGFAISGTTGAGRPSNCFRGLDTSSRTGLLSMQIELGRLRGAGAADATHRSE